MGVLYTKIILRLNKGFPIIPYPVYDAGDEHDVDGDHGRVPGDGPHPGVAVAVGEDAERDQGAHQEAVHERPDQGAEAQIL